MSMRYTKEHIDRRKQINLEIRKREVKAVMDKNFSDAMKIVGQAQAIKK